MTRSLTLALILSLIGVAPSLIIAQISADFSVRLLVDPNCVPMTASQHFIVRDLSTGPVKKWIWSTNKPSVTIHQAVSNSPTIAIETHKGEIPPNFQLTLVAVGDSSADTVVREVTVGFHFAPLPNPHPMRVVEGCAPLQVEFSSHASSIHGANMIENYLWEFGDGDGSATEQNPQYTYNTPGTYFVRHIVSDQYGCNGGGDWQDSKIKIVVLEEGECN